MKEWNINGEKVTFGVEKSSLEFDLKYLAIKFIKKERSNACHCFSLIA